MFWLKAIGVLFIFFVVIFAYFETSAAVRDGSEYRRNAFSEFCNEKGMEYAFRAGNLFNENKYYCVNSNSGESLRFEWDVKEGQYVNTGLRIWVIHDSGDR